MTTLAFELGKPSPAKVNHAHRSKSALVLLLVVINHPNIIYCATIHRYPIFSTRYSVTCKVYTGYHGTSETEHVLCACTVDNPFAKARGLSLRAGALTMHHLSLVQHNYCLSIYLFIYLFGLNTQSTLVISKSKGPSETLRDIRSSTYQMCRIEENTNRTTKFHK